MTNSISRALHDKLLAVAPVVGVSIVDEANKATWRIDFDPGATGPQVAAAQDLVAAFDITGAMDPPSPFLVPPRVVAAALDMVVTPESWDISNSNGMFNIVAAMYLDVGTYWMFFTNPEADSNYFGVITGASVQQITITDRGTDYFAIEARDGNGVLADTGKLSVQIYRIAT